MPANDNTPTTFAEWLSHEVGTRHWYTSPRPSPVTMSGRLFISYRRYTALRLKFEMLAGVLPARQGRA